MIWEFPGRVDMNLFKIENLVLPPGRKLGQVRDNRLCRRSNLFMGFRCQVSGVSKYRILNTDLAAIEAQQQSKKVHFTSDPYTSDRIRLLTPDT